MCCVHLAVNEREIAPPSCYYTPPSYFLKYSTCCKNAIGLARNSVDPQQVKNSAHSPSYVVKMDGMPWVIHSCFLSPKSTKLSVHFEISQWFVQKPKHIGKCCPAEWQAGNEIARTCLCREWLLGAIWQLHQIAIWNTTRGDVVLCHLYIGKENALLAFYVMTSCQL